MTREENQQRMEGIRQQPKKVITWEEIEQFVNSLSNNYVGVYGIPRGGLILATLYSYKNDIPVLLAPCKNCLVIDDDMGSGETIKRYIGKYDVAVMCSNKKCEVMPTYLWRYYDKESYEVFPWNTKGE